MDIPEPHWLWWTAGLLLLIAEVFVAGFYLLWFGVSAFLTGLLLWLEPSIVWYWQLALFSALSLAGILTVTPWLQKIQERDTDHPNLNRRAARYIGHSCILETPIVNGTGKVRLEDTLWLVRGPDGPAGLRVRVTGAEGSVLQVQREDGASS